MRKGELINGYLILEDFKVAGGQSKISFAKKGTQEYFIKEFLSPKYATDSSPGSVKTKERKRKKCELFENHHKKINSLISDRCALGGNLVFAIDFFRSGTTYYKINEKIDVTSMSTSMISDLPLDERLLICKTTCHSLKILHTLNIIHGDIKPHNVLIKKTKTGKYASKLIDFDNSFFTSEPPLNVEDIVGDQVYYSPELAEYILELRDRDESELTTKSDIFALGLLFCEYLTGSYPSFNKKFNYPWQALINGQPIRINKKSKLPNGLVTLLQSMIERDHLNRPSADEVFVSLKNIDEDKPEEKTTLGGTLLDKFKTKELPKSKLKGTLIKRNKV